MIADILATVMAFGTLAALARFAWNDPEGSDFIIAIAASAWVLLFGWACVWFFDRVLWPWFA